MFFQRCVAVKGIPFALTAVSESPAVRREVSQGKCQVPDDLHELDRMLDGELKS